LIENKNRKTGQSRQVDEWARNRKLWWLFVTKEVPWVSGEKGWTSRLPPFLRLVLMPARKRKNRDFPAHHSLNPQMGRLDTAGSAETLRVEAIIFIE
jgi:hypothetical protein